MVFRHFFSNLLCVFTAINSFQQPPLVRLPVLGNSVFPTIVPFVNQSSKSASDGYYPPLRTADGKESTHLGNVSGHVELPVTAAPTESLSVGAFDKSRRVDDAAASFVKVISLPSSSLRTENGTKNGHDDKIQSNLGYCNETKPELERSKSNFPGELCLYPCFSTYRFSLVTRLMSQFFLLYLVCCIDNDVLIRSRRFSYCRIDKIIGFLARTNIERKFYSISIF